MALRFAAPAHAQQFLADQPSVTQALNQYWMLQGLGQATAGVTAHWPAVFGSSDWFEWNSLKVAWTDDAADKAKQRELLQSAFVNGVNAHGAQARGYVWPANNSELWIGVQPHFDQMPRFICAVYNDYLWSRDKTFLRAMRPKLEVVMDYLKNTMRARDGLPQCPGIFNGRSGSSPNTTYMDCYREGGTVAWIAEGYATALADMAAIERLFGDRRRAAVYTSAVKAFPKQFDAGLWNAATKRYAGWRDTDGVLHDYGFTYINLEALARGLGDADKADAIFRWLDSRQARPTVAGGHVGSTDISQCVVAPRSNTAPIPAKDWDSWSVSPTLRRTSMGYGALVEDGGALLWVNYYDVLARLRWLDADSAWQKLTALLGRVAGDKLLFIEDVTHPTNVYGENYLEVGPADGSENGIAAVTPLCGFMGVHAEADGLFATPNLPTSLLFLECRGMNYGATPCSVRVARGRIVLSTPLAAEPQPFAAHAVFNTLGVLLRPDPTARITFRLEKRLNTAWVCVASASAARPEGLAYTYVTLPDQSAGVYRVTLSPAMGRVRYACRVVQEASSQTSGGTVRGQGVAFDAIRCFSKIVLRTAHGFPRGGTLFRRMGSHWHSVSATWAAGQYGGVLRFADQPAGHYRLQMQRPTYGKYALEASRYTVTVRSGGAIRSTWVAAGGTVKLKVLAASPS